jgi:serralysin
MGQTQFLCVNDPLSAPPFLSVVRHGGGETTSQVRQPAVRKEKTELWPQGSTLRVRFIGEVSAELALRIMTIAHTWSLHCNITFVHVRAPTEAEIRIRVDASGVCNSQVGRTTEAVLGKWENVPTMALGLAGVVTEDVFRRAVLHEFGHVLGLSHEHQSPAAPKWDEQAVFNHFKTTLRAPPGGWKSELDYKTHVQRNILTRICTSETNYTNFDPLSIMLYPIPDFLRQQVASPPSAAAAAAPSASASSHPPPSLPINTVLSPTDISFIARMYPKLKGVPPQLMAAKPRPLASNLEPESDFDLEGTGDVHVYGPFGGVPGKPLFSDHRSFPYAHPRNLRQVTIQAGSLIDAICVDYDGHHGTKHGGNGGNTIIIKLQPGEYITKVAGRAGSAIDRIQLWTNRGE